MTGEADRGRGCVAFVSSSACPTCHRLFLEACPLYPVSSSEIVRAGWGGGALGTSSPPSPSLGRVPGNFQDS